MLDRGVYITAINSRMDKGMSEVNKSAGNQVLLTSDDVRRWQEELRHLEQAKKDTEASIAELRRKLDMVGFLIGAKASLPATPESNDDPEKPETLGDAARRLLGEFSKPVFHRELQSALRAIPRFREMLDKNTGAYYYTMIKRLVDADPPQIKRVGKRRIRLIHKNEAPPEGNPEGAS